MFVMANCGSRKYGSKLRSSWPPSLGLIRLSYMQILRSRAHFICANGVVCLEQEVKVLHTELVTQWEEQDVEREEEYYERRCDILMSLGIEVYIVSTCVPMEEA